MLESHLLSSLVFAPAAAAVILACIPSRFVRAIRLTALGASIAVFALSLVVWAAFDPNLGGFQQLETSAWIPQFGIAYQLGVDGLSLWLVLLTTLMTPVVILASWSSVDARVRAFHICLMLLTTGILGSFLATDLFLFYVFWELMLIPMYFIIGVWGGPRRVYAAVKFVLFTMAGSVVMLVAMLFSAWHHHQLTGLWSFGFADWLETAPLMAAAGYWSPQVLVFAAFALAFAIKIPLFPVHTWLPDAHVEAPTGGSIILAGVLLKLGGYGLLRFNRSLFPDAWDLLTPVLIVLAVFGIVYGAWVAMLQPDMKKLVAYSSVSHMGFVVLGLAAGTVVSTQGAILQMVNHGLSTGALFLIVGVLYERRHTRMIADYGGLANAVPVTTGLFLLVTLSSIGLPGLNGFVGELLILVGAWPVSPVAVIVACSGIVFGAVYMLWLVQRVFWNPLTDDANRALRDVTPRELAAIAPLIVFIVWIGVYPTTFLAPMEATVRLLVGN